jgi:hypothetical protein
MWLNSRSCIRQVCHATNTNAQHAAGNIFAPCLAALASKTRILETCRRVCCICRGKAKYDTIWIVHSVYLGAFVKLRKRLWDSSCLSVSFSVHLSRKKNSTPTGQILVKLDIADYNLIFRHRASCILGQAFHYSLENAFYIFNQRIYFIVWYLLHRASLI